MEEIDTLKTDLLPYLNLQDSEEILVINRYNEKKILPIKDLAKYHDPTQLPKKFPYNGEIIIIADIFKKVWHEFYGYNFFHYILVQNLKFLRRIKSMNLHKYF